MSQNKTVFPGMNNNRETKYSNENANSNSNEQRQINCSQGTVFPGLENNSREQVSNGRSSSFYSEKPVIGFLYSVSKKGKSEYWPLHIGQNTIGTSNKCDINLCEGTISSEHAVLVVRKMKNPEKIIASISDAKSTNGTMRNGESLGFSAVECFNGDILTIGENYELLLLLIDTKELGLSVSENFIHIESQETNSCDSDQYQHITDRFEQDYPPHFEHPDNSYIQSSSKSTIGINDNQLQHHNSNDGTVGI